MTANPIMAKLDELNAARAAHADLLARAEADPLNAELQDRLHAAASPIARLEWELAELKDPGGHASRGGGRRWGE